MLAQKLLLLLSMKFNIVAMIALAATCDGPAKANRIHFTGEEDYT
jgi:hypothetical protein